MTKILEEFRPENWECDWTCPECGSVLHSNGKDVLVSSWSIVGRQMEQPYIVCPACEKKVDFTRDDGQITMDPRRVPGWVVQTAKREGRVYRSTNTGS